MPPHNPLPSLTAIVATTPTLGMGYLGSLPWPPLKPDLAFFARVTKRPPPPSPPRKNDNDKPSPHNPQTVAEQPTPAASINALLMGRKTWDSIPASRRPLGDRVNVIISRQHSALAAELARTGPGKAVGADGKQHVLVAGSIEEGLQRLVREYPPRPAAAPPHPLGTKSEDGEGTERRRSGEAVTDGNPAAHEGIEWRPWLGRVFVIGGAQIYARALELDRCERVLWTRLDREWDCDVWFPSGVLGEHEHDTKESRGNDGWARSSDDALDAWCGERVAGTHTHRLGDADLTWQLEMWERKRAS